MVHVSDDISTRRMDDKTPKNNWGIYARGKQNKGVRGEDGDEISISSTEYVGPSAISWLCLPGAGAQICSILYPVYLVKDF